MTRNQWIIAVVVVLIVGVGGFFVGKSQAASATPKGTFSGNFTGGTGAAGGFAGRAGAARTGAAGGATLGKIVSVGSGNIAIQMQNSSSSEIVLLGSNTQIMKTVLGSASDLAIGDSVTVQGTSNSDGSVSATSIQILPAGVVGRFGGGTAGGATQVQTSEAPMIPAP